MTGAVAGTAPGLLEACLQSSSVLAQAHQDVIGRSQKDDANSARVLLRLLRPAQGDPAKLTVVSPDSAELHVLMPAARKVAELQEALSHLRGDLGPLRPVPRRGSCTG
ncbi:hypothetical protein AB8O64_00620 [Streptomyces sp. QH1-20]|uniref:hypothetical protein n=1 Tax=Streptomyces sp. QH1-20 TaxID=3240934 RepID=UPI003517E9CA